MKPNPLEKSRDKNYVKRQHKILTFKMCVLQYKRLWKFHTNILYSLTSVSWLDSKTTGFSLMGTYRNIELLGLNVTRRTSTGCVNEL